MIWVIGNTFVNTEKIELLELSDQGWIIQIGGDMVKCDHDAFSERIICDSWDNALYRGEHRYARIRSEEEAKKALNEVRKKQ